MQTEHHNHMHLLLKVTTSHRSSPLEVFSQRFQLIHMHANIFNFFLHKHLLHLKTAEMLQKATSRKSECLPVSFSRQQCASLTDQ